MVFLSVKCANTLKCLKTCIHLNVGELGEHICVSGPKGGGSDRDGKGELLKEQRQDGCICLADLNNHSPESPTRSVKEQQIKL